MGADDTRRKLYSTVLVETGQGDRKARRQRQRAARQVLAQDQATTRAEAKARYEAERAEAHATTYLPRGGESGPAALRSPRRFRVPAHQDTSAALQGAYPFLAEGGLGSNGVFIGQDLYSSGSFVYDPWVLYQRGIITAPNLVLAGIVGSGKSSLAKSLYTRSIAFGRRVYVPGDPKGEHTPVAQAVGGKAIILGHGLGARLNPLDEGYRPGGVADDEWATTVAARRRDLIGALAETVLARSLTPLEHTAIDVALRATVSQSSVPILPMVVDRILAPNRAEDTDGWLAEDGRLVGHALRRLVAGDLQGMFDGPSTVRFGPTLPMLSLDLSRVVENSTLISVLMTCSDLGADDVLVGVDGVCTAGPERWATLGRLRRSVAADVAPVPAAYFIAEGRSNVHEYQGEQREQFIASRIGHDNNRTTYTVDRTRQERADADREAPERAAGERDPAAVALAQREQALQPETTASGGTVQADRAAVAR